MYFLLEPISTPITPHSQVVHFGEIASLNCKGIGSFIAITWRVNGFITCINETCDSNLVSHQDISSGNRNNLTIDSFLKVNTSLLETHFQDTIEIICIIEQMTVPPNSIQVFTTVTVNFVGKLTM